MGAEQENELTDVVLCYQALGVPLDASPVQIEQLYKALTEEHRKKLTSADPASREEARKSLEQINEMYNKILGSVTYRSAEREHQKHKEAGSASREAPIKVQRAAEQKRTVACPRCNGEMAKGLKVCPICKSLLYTPVERLFKELFTPKKIIFYCILLVGFGAAMFFLNQERRSSSDISEIESLEQKAPPK